MLISLDDIRSVADEIRQQFHPEKIILFGSYAEGNATPDSDADLFIIMDTDQRPLRQAAAISGAVRHTFPLDIIVRTPQQIQERLSWGDSFVSQILEKGLVLYEASDNRVG